MLLDADDHIIPAFQVIIFKLVFNMFGFIQLDITLGFQVA